MDSSRAGPTTSFPTDLYPGAIFACEVCKKDFSGPSGWQRRARHMEEGACRKGKASTSRQEESSQGATKRQRTSNAGSSVGSSSTKSDRDYLIKAPTTTEPPLVPPRFDNLQELHSKEAEILNYLRLESDPRLHELSKQALVSAVLECTDLELVRSVEATFHQFEVWAIGKKISQYPVCGLKVALFLSEFLNRPRPTSATPPSHSQSATFSHRTNITTLLQWISVLQSCATATAFQSFPDGTYVYAPHKADNLATHSAVACVLEEARNHEASEVLASFRSTGSSTRVSPTSHAQSSASTSITSVAPPKYPSVLQTVEPRRAASQATPPAPRRKRKHSPPVQTSSQGPSAITTPTPVPVSVVDNFFPVWRRDGPLPSPAQILAASCITWKPPPSPLTNTNTNERSPEGSQIGQNVSGLPDSPTPTPASSRAGHARRIESVREEDVVRALMLPPPLIEPKSSL